MSGGTIDRLSILRFPLIILVIYLHSSGGTVNFGAGAVTITAPWVRQSQYIVGSCIARIAVPLFFVISGYLFFLGTSRWSMAAYRAKLKRRWYSLAIPYLFWNIALLAASAAAQAISSLRPFFGTSMLISDMSPWEIVDLALGITFNPISYQFWFIRDLMILVVLSPLFYFVLRSAAGAVVLLFLFGLLFVHYWPLPLTGPEPVAYFSTGAFLAINAISPFPPKRSGLPLIIAYILILASSFILEGGLVGTFFLNLSIVTGVALALWLSGAVTGQLRNVLIGLAPASFFVFATHEPLVTICRKIIYGLSDINAVGAFLAFVLIPPFVATICLVTYFALARLAPKPLSFITGNRAS